MGCILPGGRRASASCSSRGRASGRVQYACVQVLESRRLLAATLLPATWVHDLVYDAAHNDVCMVTGAGQVLRYDLDANGWLDPISAGTNLGGVDITPDGKYLYTADTGANAVRKVDLSNGQVTSLTYTPASDEGYALDVRILSDGYAYFTGQFRGSEPVIFRRINLADDSIGSVPGVDAMQQGAPLARSADRKTLFWQEPNIWNGPIALYDATSDGVVSNRNTNEFVGRDEAVSRDGQLVAMYLSGQLTILDRQLGNIRTLGSNSAEFGFDPRRDVFYVADFTTDQVIAYSTITWQEKYRLDLGQSVDPATSRAGTMALNGNGDTLFVSTADGVLRVSLPVADGQAKSGVISGFPSFIKTGVQGSFTLQVVDGAGEVATGFRGRVHFASSDPGAILPADYTFTAADNGTHSFTATLNTVGTQTLSVSVVGGTLSGSQGGIEVHEPGRALVPAPGQDMVYDALRNDLYIVTSSGKVQRYDLASETLLAPWDVGVDLGGADITPDGKYLYVADMGANAVRKVDLSNGQVASLTYTAGDREGYAWDLKILSDGYAYFTGQSWGSRDVVFRRINLADDSIGSVPGINPLDHNAPLARSADRKTLFWQEPNIWGSPVALYDATTDAIVSSWEAGQYGAGVAAVSRDGQLVAMYHSGQLTILNRQLMAVWAFGSNTAGFGFDPQRDVFYVVDPSVSQVIAYSTATWQEKYRVGLAQNIANTISRFGPGTIALSGNGTLFLSTTYSIQVLSLPQADGQAARMAVSGFPSFIKTGVAGSLTLQFVDGAGEPAGAFRGKVHFSSSDPSAVLPADYTFTAADNGTHGFAATLNTVGTQTLNVSMVGGTISGSQGAIEVHEPGRALVPAPGQDMVYDALRNDLYIVTSSGKVQRYDLASETLLAPWDVGVSLGGADITPDGKYLYIADMGANAVQKVDLSNGQVTSLTYPVATGAGYAWDLKILSDGYAYFTAQPISAGDVRFLRINLADDSISGVLDGYVLGLRAPLARSADRQWLFWQSPASSLGSIALYDAETETIAKDRTTNQFVGMASAVSRDGQMVAMILGSQLTVLNQELGSVRPLGADIAGFGFDPQRDVFYVVDSSADQVIAYSSSTWQEKYRLDLGQNVYATANRFGAGVTSLSPDGMKLFLMTPQGVRVVSLPQADGQAARMAVSGFPSFIKTGVAGSLTLQFVDAAGEPAGTFRGKVHFSSSDPSAVLPADYTFTAADNGTHSFTATLNTVGTQTLSVSMVGGTLSGSQGAIEVHEPGRALVPAPGQDMVYDPLRNDLYIVTSSGKVQRYDLASETLLAPWNVGVSLGGADITPDGKYLYIADRRADVVQKVDLSSGRATSISCAPSGLEVYVWDLKILSDGYAYITRQANGGGIVQLQRIRLADGSVGAAGISVLDAPGKGAPLARSADGQTLFWQNPDSSDGPIALYDAETDSVVARRDTFHYLPAAVPAVSRDGQFVAMILSGQLTFLDRQLRTVGTLGCSVGGFGFDPQRDVFYVVDSSADQVIAYNTSTWQEKYRIDIGQNVDAGFSAETMALSQDGTKLFVMTAQGVRVMSLPQPDGKAARAVISGFPSYIKTGVPGSFTLQVLDGAGEPATSFRGKVHFASSDLSALLPADYTFTAADAGSHTFRVTLKTSGMQKITATLVGTTISTSQDDIAVHAPGFGWVLVGAADIVMDDTRGELLITDGSGVLQRYDLRTETLLSPIAAGGKPPRRGYYARRALPVCG